MSAPLGYRDEPRTGLLIGNYVGPAEEHEAEPTICRVLNRERPILSKLIEDLPPIGGGRSAVAVRLPRPKK